MPDGDVYDRHVDRGWQTAARRVFESDDDELALPSLLRALGRMLKDGGCPGIDAVVEIPTEALGSPGGGAVRREARAQLERVRREAASDRTNVVIDAALRLLAEPESLGLGDLIRQNTDAVRQKIAEQLLVELAARKFSPGVLLQDQVVNRGVGIEVYRRRAERGRSLLASSPELSRLACQVMAHPNGVGIRAPRPKSPKPSQEALVHMPISS
jgi:hypothetical protein